MINSTIKFDKSNTKKTYPYLGIYIDKEERRIVLFDGPNRGTTLLDSIDMYPLGRHDEDWAEENFVVFIGNLTLRNNT